MAKENKIKEEKKLTKKQVIIRIILFVLVGFIAIGAFVIAFINIGGYEKGYNKIEGSSLENAPNYQNGISFVYYLDGNKMDIKTTANYLKSEYTLSLSRIFMLTDSGKEYTGYKNIYSLNNELGNEIQLSAELYNILVDAYQRTLQQEGYNMFAGALYKEWESVLVLDENEEFDPLNNSTIKERIAAISNIVNDLSNFSLSFSNDESRMVKFDVSQKYKDFIAEYEIESYPIIDLNVLKDAYKIRYVANYFNNLGYKKGYLSSTSGITVSFDDNYDAAFTLYSLPNNGTLETRAYALMETGSKTSIFKSFKYDNSEILYYEIEKDGVLYYRHPYISVSGKINDLILTSIVKTQESIIDACYKNIILYSFETREQLEAYINDNKDIICAYILREDNKLYISENGKKYISKEMFDLTLE